MLSILFFLIPPPLSHSEMDMVWNKSIHVSMLTILFCFFVLVNVQVFKYGLYVYIHVCMQGYFCSFCILKSILRMYLYVCMKLYVWMNSGCYVAIVLCVLYVQNALYFSCYMMLMFNLCNVFVLVFVMRSESILLWRIALYKNDLLLLLLPLQKCRG